ncbi:MAG: hypothetical protein IJM46_03130 [Oscillospiraceae bacterium]|jgi:hypothetical protein|nr:hypothetical protein [Oscillospiraceae bacterium]
MDALLEKIAMHPYWSMPHHMVGLAFVIGFSIALIVTIISCVRKIERCRVKIEAEIIDNVKRMRTDEDGHRYACYVPVYSYFYEGRTYTPEGYRSSGAPYKVGKRVKLHLDPEYPSQFAERGMDIGNAIGWGIGEVIFLCVGILLLLTEEEFS